MEVCDLGLPAGGYLSLTSFVASSHPADSCGLNGLPLTPNSVKVLGNGQLLKAVNHPNLAHYLDIVRGKRQRIAVVSECWKKNLRSLQQESGDVVQSADCLMDMAAQILSGLSYLNSMNIINLNLTPENIMFDDDGKVKLFGYGYGRMTDYGRLVSFPIGSPRYTAPDVLRRGMQTEVPLELSLDMASSMEAPTTIPEEIDVPDLPQVDVWSLGMILARQIFQINEFWSTLKVGQVLRKILSLGDCATGAAVLEKLGREHNCFDKLSKVDACLLELVHRCLTPRSDDRPSPATLLKSELFEGRRIISPTQYSPASFPVMKLRCEQLQLDKYAKFSSCLHFVTVQEIYYLWQLAGGDIWAELCKHGLMVTTPPVISTPTLVTGEGQEFGVPRQRGALLDHTIINLPLDQLIHCLNTLPTKYLLPTIQDIDDGEINTLPLVIKEKDVRLQCRRVIAYRTLLQGYPYRIDKIIEQCYHDLVPLYRAQLWASLLGIDFDTEDQYNAIDKVTPNPVDRQIEVDIPRCHQYNELLASPQGHRKLKRVLKGWVMSNPDLVYWQGLDSLCAPFLLLNFNNESLAWACLSAFIPKYLYNMFQKDNAAVIQEYLAKFSHLQAFYDPILFNHMDEIGFIPDLYAIPWVLTMFSHVFPLHKIFHLWDTLLLGNSNYPLCVGMAILLQLRSQLLESQFNECILLFSEMPSVDIDQVVMQSKIIFDGVPNSVLHRTHDYHQPSPPSSEPLDLPPLEVGILKSEKIARISARDCIDLIDSSLKERINPHESLKILVIDIRTIEEFRTGSLSGAINLPANQFLELGLVPAHPALDLAKQKGSVIAVLGREKGDEMLQVAEVLLAHQIARVVTVHGGIQIFRKTNAIIVPNLS